MSEAPLRPSLSRFLCASHAIAVGRKGKTMAFAPERLGQLLEDYHRPEHMLRPERIFDLELTTPVPMVPVRLNGIPTRQSPPGAVELTLLRELLGRFRPVSLISRSLKG